jgi:hypothetical protein
MHLLQLTDMDRIRGGEDVANPVVQTDAIEEHVGGPSAKASGEDFAVVGEDLVPIWLSLLVIVVVLGAAVFLSLRIPPREGLGAKLRFPKAPEPAGGEAGNPGSGRAES